MALDRNQFGDLVRNWVHYDNLASNLNRQIQNARKVKDEFETKIMNSLRDFNMENAIIQIAGGKLCVTEEKHTNPLTITRIEELLHEYYECHSLLFLKSDCKVHLCVYLPMKPSSSSLS